MKNIQLLKSKIDADWLGALASGLCLVHCLATPILFVVQSCTTTGCCSGGPLWWSFIDYLFIGITFFAVAQSARTSSSKWMTYGLGVTWGILTLFILNEKFTLFPLSEYYKYTAALSMISLHLINLKYCRCKEDACCIA